jgi:hypothetical protein
LCVDSVIINTGTKTEQQCSDIGASDPLSLF